MAAPGMPIRRQVVSLRASECIMALSLLPHISIVTPLHSGRWMVCLCRMSAAQMSAALSKGAFRNVWLRLQSHRGERWDPAEPLLALLGKALSAGGPWPAV